METIDGSTMTYNELVRRAATSATHLGLLVFLAQTGRGTTQPGGIYPGIKIDVERNLRFVGYLASGAAKIPDRDIEPDWAAFGG